MSAIQLALIVLHAMLFAPMSQGQRTATPVSISVAFVITLKVPLRRKFIGLFPSNSVAEYRVLFIFPQKTEQQTFHPNIF